MVHRKGKQFDKLLADAIANTQPYAKELKEIIDLTIPMNKIEVEVFATVHAAWNNLILDGIDPTDEAIISAAREEWHPDKLAIPVSKFRDAIRLIREKGLEPDGSAKRVVGQATLSWGQV